MLRKATSLLVPICYYSVSRNEQRSCFPQESERSELNYFIHLILSYTDPLALLQISNCNKRFGQISKNEKYYDYVVCDDCRLDEALDKGHLGCLNKLDKDLEENYLIALEKGHLHVFKWLIEKNYKFKNIVINVFAKNGNLECLKYAHENGCEWDKEKCCDAVRNRHLECLKYIQENE